MADDLSDLSSVHEGLGTLAAQFTRRTADRILRIVRAELQKGTPEAAIAAAMARDLPEYDEHTRALMLNLGAGRAVADDFPPALVKNRAQPKPNTMLLTLSKLPEGIQLHTLVQHDSKQWLVIELKGATLTLKVLE